MQFGRPPGAKNINYAETFLRDVLAVTLQRVVMFTDNRGAEFISRSDASVRKVRHIIFAIFWLREMIQERKWEVAPIPTDDNVSDVLTKAVSGPRLRVLRALLYPQ